MRARCEEWTKPSRWFSPCPESATAGGSGDALRAAGGEKQPAEPLPFEVADTNDAMAKVIGWLVENWTELIS